MPLANIPGGLEIHNIEMNPGQGGKLVRSAGGVARLGAKEGEWSVIILPSGEMRRVKSKCRATIGQLGNLDWINVSIGKAGRIRHMGIRPHTRAKAMNPIDHPLGGGEGRCNGGRHPVSKTGVPAKGGITRQPAEAQREADPASPQVRQAPAASADGERVTSRVVDVDRTATRRSGEPT